MRHQLRDELVQKKGLVSLKSRDFKQTDNEIGCNFELIHLK